LISQFPAYSGLESAKAGLMPVAEQVTQEVLCLPIYPNLDKKAVFFITNLIKSRLL